MNPIHHVLIYTGHAGRGPYAGEITQRINMFKALIPLRLELGHFPWSVEPFDGQDLALTLKTHRPEKTLVVIPAGPSSELDSVFKDEDTLALREYIKAGGRGYFTCGSAYWVSQTRIYSDISGLHPTERITTEKVSKCPLFAGIARGPLCPFPGHKYKVGFFSDAVEFKAKDGEKCTLLVSGGGSFYLPSRKTPAVDVILEYTEEELKRLGKTPDWKNAAIRIRQGLGQALLVMTHPYYGPEDIDSERYYQAFPDSGSDWHAIHRRLTAEKERLIFIQKQLIAPLES